MGGTWGLTASLNRLFWYPPWADSSYYTPTFWIDGRDSLSYSWPVNTWWNQLRSRISTRLSDPSPVEIDLQVFYSPESDTGTAIVQVVATDPITYTGLRLFLAVTQDGLSGGDHTCNQVVRAWEPNWGGVAFSIAQGDTFTHTEEFIIKAAWVEENCHIAAFVQDSRTYDVLQSTRSPLLVPTPENVTDLTVNLVDSDLRLGWSAVTADTWGDPLIVDSYRVYRDTVAFRDPGSDPLFTTANTFFIDDSGVVGDVSRQYLYWVTAVKDYKESAESDGVGEFDRLVQSGK